MVERFQFQMWRFDILVIKTSREVASECTKKRKACTDHLPQSESFNQSAQKRYESRSSKCHVLTTKLVPVEELLGGKRGGIGFLVSIGKTPTGLPTDFGTALLLDFI